MSVATFPTESRLVLKTWFTQSKHTDYTFILVDKRKRKVEVKCHKLVMATRSTVLEQIIYARFAGNIRSLDDKYEDFMDFLLYLYTDVMDPQTITTVFKCAIKYKVDLSLADFNEAISIENMISLYAIAKPIGDEAKVFVDILEQRISAQASQVLSSNSAPFLILKTEELIQLLQLRNMKISVSELVQAISDWTEFQCHRLGMRLSSANKSKVLGVRLETLPSLQTVIRAMSVTEFQKYLSTGDYADFLTRDDIIHLTLDEAVVGGMGEPEYCMHGEACNMDEQENESVRVNIKFVTNNSFFSVDLLPFSRVEHLKAGICEKTGVTVNEQRLIFRGRPLKDKQTIASCRIQTGEVIHFARGG